MLVRKRILVENCIDMLAELGTRRQYCDKHILAEQSVRSEDESSCRFSDKLRPSQICGFRLPAWWLKLPRAIAPQATESRQETWHLARTFAWKQKTGCGAVQFSCHQAPNRTEGRGVLTYASLVEALSDSL